jgi:Putative beta-barrel porin-2, OmpL-like. bbp2
MQKIEQNQLNRRNQMKFNKWTLGLAAIGAVSLTSAARADDVTNSLMTAVASTTISGYVDTSINWTPGTGNFFSPAYAYNGSPGYGGAGGSKADGFNLNSVNVVLQKAEDETEWASGYMVDVFLGPDAASLGTGFGNSIKQAYVTLRTPVGTGIDWKLGVWDTIIGYEATEDPNNPNYTRSYGYTIEPTTHTGLNGTYKISDAASVTLGVANTSTVATINGRANPPFAESYKTYLGALSLTAPTNWGFLSGSSGYLGFINGFDANTVGAAQNLYVGSTLNTPMSELKVGFSYDYFYSKQGYLAPNFGAPLIDHQQSWANAVDFYSTFQATDKLSFNSRAEYFWESSLTGPVPGPDKVFALTETVEYDLWKNVMSRIEVRWDHQCGTVNGGTPANTYNGGYGGYVATGPANAVAGTVHNSYQIMANIIYKF